MHQQDLTREPRRLGRLLNEVGDDVVERGFGHSGHGVLEEKFLFELHERVAAAGRQRGLLHHVSRRVGAVSQDVVPEHLDPLLGDRKWDALHRTGHSIAARRETGSGGDALGGIVDPLRRRGTAARRIHDHLVVFVGLKQTLVPRRELVGVLAHVGRGDGEQRLVARERIGMVLAGLEVRKARLGG